MQYLVKWQEWNLALDNTWEPVSHIPELYITEFEEMFTLTRRKKGVNLRTYKEVKTIHKFGTLEWDPQAKKQPKKSKPPVQINASCFALH